MRASSALRLTLVWCGWCLVKCMDYGARAMQRINEGASSSEVVSLFRASVHLFDVRTDTDARTKWNNFGISLLKAAEAEGVRTQSPRGRSALSQSAVSHSAAARRHALWALVAFECTAGSTLWS